MTDNINWIDVLKNLIDDWYQSYNVYTNCGRSMDKVNKQFNEDLKAIQKHIDETK